jgi:AcrR family transcriptional regulator
MREVKKPEERKADILLMSERLFLEKGYINTTTNDIITALGISRGLLYYHFNSKEDILWHIIEYKTQSLITKFQQIAENSEMTAKQKILAFIDATVTVDPENTKLSAEKIEEQKKLQEAIQLKENDFMIDKINHKIAYEATFSLEKIIRQGIEEKIFIVTFPHATAAFLMTGFTFVMNDPFFHNNGIKEQRVLFQGFKALLNQTLGLETPLYD